jgi:hypothetical protein
VTRSLALLVLLAGVAQAANPARYRFHVVGDRLMRKVSLGAQRNERAIAAFPHATAFVVAADPQRPRRVLVLTNNHVAGNGPPGDITFRDGTTGHALRTVASNPALDYAAVEVELTGGPRANGVEPLTLERSAYPMRGNDRIYTLGGHTGLDVFQRPRESIAGGEHSERAIAQTIADARARGDVAGFRTIAVGKVFAGTDGARSIYANGSSTMAIESELPNAPGMSGSPVMSRATHKVVGLHFGGFGATHSEWTESAVPMDLLLSDLRQRLQNNAVDPSARDLVQRVVDGE